MGRRSRLAAAMLLPPALLATGCPAGRPAPAATGCPAAYAAPDPDRPRVGLAFRLTADHARLLGREHVTFRPDRDVDRLVFRLWPANPISAGHGAAITVTGARLDGRPVPVRPDQRDPTVLPLPARVAAGRSVTADLVFTVALPRVAGDRMGHTATTAWWGSAYPLLSWQPGTGWATEPPGGFLSESVTSPAAAVDVTVDAPRVDTVLATGRPTGPPQAGAGGYRRWRFHAEAARDVSVAASPFRLARGSVLGVPVVVGLAPEVRRVRADRTLLEALRAVRLHAARFGPFPYGALSVAVLPGIGRRGVEYPGAVQVGDAPARQRLVVVHEVAHQWFYGLIGDDQARHPWLDEAFASYAEALADGDPGSYLGALRLPDPVDQPVTAFGTDARRYAAVVYGKGAAALLTARARVGAARFDAALRCYVAGQAWRIAVPGDVGAALAGLPEARRVLADAGALAG